MRIGGGRLTDSLAGLTLTSQGSNAPTSLQPPAPTPSCLPHVTPARNISSTLTQLLLSHNDFEGDLSMLGPSRLMIVSVNDNPKLCGMVRLTRV
jgi:hypothetical protein